MIVAACVYGRSLGNEFVYDDTKVVLEARAPDSIASFARIFAERHFYNLPYYRPITRSTLLGQKALHGDEPSLFHLFNVVLAAGTAWLAFLLLRLPAFGIPPPAAFAAALLFLVHPVASSCVYPISSGRETMMPTAWTIAAILCWMTGRWRAAWALFAGSLLCKESAVVTPALFVLADLTVADRPRRAMWISRYWPAMPIFAIYFAIRHALFGSGEYDPGQFARVAMSYLYALQTLFFPYFELRYEPDVPQWFSWTRAPLALAAALMMAFLLWRRKNPRDLFFAGWFAILLLPTANLIKQEAMFDERYVWPASLAMFAMAASVAPVRRWTAGVAGLAFVLFAAIGFSRSAAFADDVAFSTQWLRTNPGTVNAQYNLGMAYDRLGMRAEAATAYRRTIQLKPDYADAYNNLGKSLLELGAKSEAEAALRQAVRLNPNLAIAWVNLGALLLDDNRGADAVAPLKEGIRLLPSYAPAHTYLGTALAQIGKEEEARNYYERAVSLNPGDEQARRWLERSQPGQ